MGKKIMNILLLILVVLAAAGLTVFVGRDAVGMMIYNFVFLAVMVILFLVGMFGGMFRILDLASAFKRGTENLVSAFKQKGKADPRRIQLLSGIFAHKYLDEKIDNFLLAIENSEEGIVEVEEYINEDEIDVHVHKRMLEMVPDILTSLGILGTFVGLVWGLKDFSPSNYEAMTNSVASLVEGIKVAFLTSIYGISLSIVYSYGMKSAYSSMGAKIQEFLENFHTNVLPTAETESRNQMLSSAKQQSEVMEKMSEKIAKDMADNFERAITPVFDRMSTSVDRLAESTGAGPEAALEAIVQGFLNEMNRTFRIQLSNFDGALEDLRKTQTSTAEFTESLYKNFSRELNDTYAKQERQMKNSVRELINTIDNFTRTAGDTASHNLEVQKQTRVDYEHILTYMKDAERTSGQFWEACNQSMQKYVQLAADSTEKVGNAGKISAAVIRENRGILQTLDERIQQYAVQERDATKAVSELTRLLSDMTAERSGNDIQIKTGTVSRNREYERLQAAIEEQGERQEALLRELIDSVRELSKASKKSSSRLFK